jgi:DNA-binding phage protein
MDTVKRTGVFDMAQYLNTDEGVPECLSQMLEDGDPRACGHAGTY